MIRAKQKKYRRWLIGALAFTAGFLAVRCGENSDESSYHNVPGCSERVRTAYNLADTKYRAFKHRNSKPPFDYFEAFERYQEAESVKRAAHEIPYESPLYCFLNSAKGNVYGYSAGASIATEMMEYMEEFRRKYR